MKPPKSSHPAIHTTSEPLSSCLTITSSNAETALSNQSGTLRSSGPILCDWKGVCGSCQAGLFAGTKPPGVSEPLPQRQTQWLHSAHCRHQVVYTGGDRGGVDAYWHQDAQFQLPKSSGGLSVEQARPDEEERLSKDSLD